MWMYYFLKIEISKMKKEEICNIISTVQNGHRKISSRNYTKVAIRFSLELQGFYVCIFQSFFANNIIFNENKFIWKQMENMKCLNVGNLFLKSLKDL